MKNTLVKTLLATLACALYIPLQAATITVSSNLDSGSGCTLRKAIAKINTAGVAVNDCSSIGSFGNEDTINLLLPTNSKISLLSSGIDLTESMEITTQSEGITIEPKSGEVVFTIGQENQIVDVTLRNLTFTNASREDMNGGAIVINQPLTTVKVENSSFTSNYARLGSGIYLTAGRLSVRDSVFNDNAAQYWGAGVYCDAPFTPMASCEIRRSTFENNLGLVGLQATDIGTDPDGGAAIYLSEIQNVTIVDSQFNANRLLDTAIEDGAGGAVAINNAKNVSIFSNSFVGNKAGFGGAVFLKQLIGEISVAGNMFELNEAGVFGGALMTWNIGKADQAAKLVSNSFVQNKAPNGAALLAYTDHIENTNNTWFANRASADGGAVKLISPRRHVMKHNTFVENHADTDGGAVMTESGGNVEIVNNLFIKNRAGNLGADIRSSGTNFADLDNNILGDTEITTTQSVVGLTLPATTVYGTNDAATPHTINEVLLPPVRNELQFIFVPLIGSPVVNAASVSHCPTLDQRGRVRVTTACDVGAIELKESDIAAQQIYDTQFIVIPTSDHNVVVVPL